MAGLGGEAAMHLPVLFGPVTSQWGTLGTVTSYRGTCLSKISTAGQCAAHFGQKGKFEIAFLKQKSHPFKCWIQSFKNIVWPELNLSVGGLSPQLIVLTFVFNFGLPEGQDGPCLLFDASCCPYRAT